MSGVWFHNGCHWKQTHQAKVLFLPWGMRACWLAPARWAHKPTIRPCQSTAASMPGCQDFDEWDTYSHLFTQWSTVYICEVSSVFLRYWFSQKCNCLIILVSFQICMTQNETLHWSFFFMHLQCNWDWDFQASESTFKVSFKYWKTEI